MKLPGRIYGIAALVAASALLLSCNQKASSSGKPAGPGAPAEQAASQGAGKAKVTTAPFGTTADGEAVELVTLTNKNGMTAKIATFGATLVALEVPDRNGKAESVVLGLDTLDEYVKDTNYFGGTIGRYGNRIAKGKFTLDGKEYQLATNNNTNHLHGGDKGFNKRVWKAQVADDGTARVKLTYTSPDGEENYPGTLEAAVTYTLTDENELRLDYEASTDKKTLCNLTNHSYFNLGGHGSGSTLEHELKLPCEKYLPTDDTLIPLGEIVAVEGTPMDFRKGKTIGADIGQQGEKYKILYDLNFVIPRKGEGLELAARVTDPKSGRSMEIYTTEPGLQFYTGNHLDGIHGAGGATYNKHQGFCLETQHYPDSPNQPDYPSTVLEPGQAYKTTTVHKFDWPK